MSGQSRDFDVSRDHPGWSYPSHMDPRNPAAKPFAYLENEDGTLTKVSLDSLDPEDRAALLSDEPGVPMTIEELERALETDEWPESLK